MDPVNSVHLHTAEEQLPQAEPVRLLFAQMPGAIWATDRKLRITHVFGRIEGQSLGQPVIGATVGSIIGTEDPREAAIAVHLAALAGQTRSARYRFLGRWYDIHVEPLRDTDSEFRDHRRGRGRCRHYAPA